MGTVAVPVFSLRIRQERLRALIREVAAQEHISQNELLEQAAEHEVIARGALIAEDLTAAATHLSALTETAYRDLVATSITDFAAGEALGEPIQARRISRHPEPATDPQQLVAVAAFQAAP